MIAIACGLLVGPETAAATVAKKDGGSGEFAAAFEEVSAKDAATVVQVGHSSAGRRAVGGSNRGGQAGRVEARSGRSGLPVAKAPGSAVGGKLAAESSVAADAGLIGESSPLAGPTGSAANAAARSVSQVKPDTADRIPTEEAAQATVVEGGANIGPLPAGKEGTSRRSLKSFEEDSPVASPVTVAAGKAEAHSPASAAVTKVPGGGPALPGGGAAFAEVKTGEPQDAETTVAGSAEALRTAEGVSAKAVAAAVSELPGTSGIVVATQRLASPLVGQGGASAVSSPPQESASAEVVAAGVTGRSALEPRGSGSKVAAKTQQDRDSASSTAKQAFQETVSAIGAQPVQGRVDHVASAIAPDPAVAIVQPALPAIPATGAELAGQAGTLAPQTLTDFAVTAQRGDHNAGNGAVALVTGSTSELRPSAQQTVAAAHSGLEQSGTSRIVPQQAVLQQAPAPSQGLPGLVGQQIDKGVDAPGSPNEAQGRTSFRHDDAQADVLKQVVAPQAASGVAIPQTETSPQDRLTAEARGQNQDFSASGTVETTQHLSTPAEAEKAKDRPVVASTRAGSASKTGKSASDSLFPADAGLTPVTADPASSAAPIAVPAASSLPAGVVFAPSVNGPGTTPARVSASGVTASASKEITAGSKGDQPVALHVLDATTTAGGAGAQETIFEEGSGAGILGQAQGLNGLASNPLVLEAAAPQRVGAATAGGPAVREKKLPNSDSRAVEKTPVEIPLTIPVGVTAHAALAGPEAVKPPSGAHQTAADAGSQSLSAGWAGPGSAVPLSSGQQTSHPVVVPSIAPSPAAGGIALSANTASGTQALSSTGLAGPDALVSPLAHTTLQATPTVLEIGVPSGTHGWLKIRAEIGEGGAVQASMSAATHEGQESLRRELPAMNAFLDSEHVPVSVQVAAHGLGNAASSVVNGSAANGDAGFNLGTTLSQDTSQGRSEAGAGTLTGGDGARQGRGEGSEDSNRAVSTGTTAGARAASSAESDWVSTASADSRAGYGSGLSRNGGSWLNVMA